MEPQIITTLEPAYPDQPIPDGIYTFEGHDKLYKVVIEEVMVCPVCGKPCTPEYAPCGHGLQNVRKCE